MGNIAPRGDAPSLTFSPLIAEAPKETPLQEFARSVAYSAIQSPMKALAQPIDRALGGNAVEKSVSFIDAPQEADYNTGSYWIQQTGHAIGMLGTFWVAGKLTRGVMRRGMTEEQLASTLGQRGVLGLTLKEAALTGFVHDSLLRPTDSKDPRSFLMSRLGNGMTGAVTMTALTGAGMGLKGIGVRSDLLAGAASGVPAGFLAAQTDSLLRTGNFAKAEDIGKSIHTMTVLGGAFGAWHQVRGQHESGRQNFDWNSEGKKYQVSGGESALNQALQSLAAGEAATVKVREHLGPATGWRGFLGLQKFGPEQSMLVQHGPKVDMGLATSVDLVASCGLAGTARVRGVLDANSLFLRSGRDRISIAAEPQATRQGERTPVELGREPSAAREQSKISQALEDVAAQYRTDKQFAKSHEGLQYHDLDAYAKALEKSGHEPVEFLGAGFESVAFLLKDGSVLKITRTAELPGGQWNDTWGTRPYDAKIKGEVKLMETSAGEIAVYRQPQVDVGAVDLEGREYRKFERKVRNNGDEMWDADFAETQVGFLIDPSTGDYVTRPDKSPLGKVRRNDDGTIRMIPVVVLVDYPSVAPAGEHVNARDINRMFGNDGN